MSSAYLCLSHIGIVLLDLHASCNFHIWAGFQKYHFTEKPLGTAWFHLPCSRLSWLLVVLLVLFERRLCPYFERQLMGRSPSRAKWPSCGQHVATSKDDWKTGLRETETTMFKIALKLILERLTGRLDRERTGWEHFQYERIILLASFRMGGLKWPIYHFCKSLCSDGLPNSPSYASTKA